MRNTAAFLRDVQGELWCYHIGYMQIVAGFTFCNSAGFWRVNFLYVVIVIYIQQFCTNGQMFVFLEWVFYRCSRAPAAFQY